MSSSNLIRWSGLAALLGGVLLPLSWILHFIVYDPSSPQILDNVMEFVAAILLVFGLMGIYGFQIEETRVYGFLGFLLTIISYCITLGQTWLPERGTLVGVGVVLGPLTGVTLLLGFILLGIGSWQANRIPRWTIALWVIGSACIVPGYPLASLSAAKFLIVIGGVVLGLGLVGAGFKLWSGPVESSRQSEAKT
jgi:hypothetical protein